MGETAEGSAIFVPDAQTKRDAPTRQVVVHSGEITNPLQLLAVAVSQGADIEKLRELRALQKEWEADEARKAFVVAMAQFKQDAPNIVKDKHVAYTKKDGSVTEYNHATLANVCAAAIAGLAKVGISHRWRTQQENARIRVTCILTHAKGHSEETALESAPDDSGGKNSIQAIASAVSYLQRYTLLSATGLATAEQDDDGRGSGDDKPRINEKQLADLEALIDECLPAGRKKLLDYWKITNFSEIPAASFEASCRDVRALGAARHQRGPKERAR